MNSSMKRSCFVLCLSFAVAAQIFVAANTVLADEAEIKKQVSDLFSTGWKVGASDQAAADALYQAATHDLRVEQAWALVLVKQRRYDQALEQFDAILLRQPDDRSAAMWKIRIRILTRKFPAAVVEMEHLARLVSKSPADTQHEPSNLANAKFLGRAFGFLSGPASLPANTRDDVKTRLLGLLEGDRLAAFEEGQKGVLDQFAQLKVQREQVQADAKKKEENDKQQAKEQLDGKKAQLDKDVGDVNADRSRVRDEQRQDESGLSRDIRQADAAQAAAEAQYASTMNQWNMLQAERAQFAAAFDAEKDAARKELLRAQIAQIDLSFLPVDADLRQREVSVTQARARRAQLEQSRLELQQRYQTTYAGLDHREGSIRRDQTRLGGLQKKNDRPASGSSSRGRNLATRAAAYTTYEEFPLEAEKAALLGSFK